MKAKIIALAVALAMPVSAASAATIQYTGVVSSGGGIFPIKIGDPFSMSYSFDPAQPNVFSASFFTPGLAGSGANSINSADCNPPGVSCSARLSFTTGSSFSQSASLNARIVNISISSALSFDFPVGDITEAFAYRGTGIGSGSYNLGTTVGGANLGLRIDTVSVNGAPVPTPLPAALPLFAAGLGILGVAGWRKKRKACGSSAPKGCV
jgi:hypothetical protein